MSPASLGFEGVKIHNAPKLTTQERVAKIIDAIIKHGKEERENVRLNDKKFILPIFFTKRLGMSYYPIGTEGKDGANIGISMADQKLILCAREEGDSHEIVGLRIEEMELPEDQGGSNLTLEETIALIEKIIAEDYPEQGTATKQELAANLEGKTE